MGGACSRMQGLGRTQDAGQTKGRGRDSDNRRLNIGAWGKVGRGCADGGAQGGSLWEGGISADSLKEGREHIIRLSLGRMV